MKSFIVLIIYFFYLIEVGSYKKNRIGEQNLAGVWKVSCEDGSGFMRYKDKNNIILEINSNQIYVLVKADYTVQKDTLSGMLYLIEPDDLGAGGMKLKWGNYSKKIPIAEIKMFNTKNIELRWLGFYNDNNKKREWVNNIDWLLSGNKNNPICLQKCL